MDRTPVYASCNRFKLWVKLCPISHYIVSTRVYWSRILAFLPRVNCYRKIKKSVLIRNIDKFWNMGRFKNWNRRIHIISKEKMFVNFNIFIIRSNQRSTLKFDSYFQRIESLESKFGFIEQSIIIIPSTKSMQNGNNSFWNIADFNLIICTFNCSTWISRCWLGTNVLDARCRNILLFSDVDNPFLPRCKLPILTALVHVFARMGKFLRRFGKLL